MQLQILTIEKSPHCCVEISYEHFTYPLGRPNIVPGVQLRESTSGILPLKVSSAHFYTEKSPTFVGGFLFEILTFLGRPTYCRSVATVRWTVVATRHINSKSSTLSCGASLCSRYLSSRAVTRQVLSAQTSLTSVFGMGTGGPTWQSIPTLKWNYHLTTSTV